MWENVVRVNGVVREDLETAITRHTRLCEEEREYGRARRLITDETEEPLPMLPCAGDDGSARDAPLARLGGATPSAAQLAAVDWLDANREQLAPVSRELVPSLGYIGSLDLRVQRGERLHELRAEELSARGPYWLGFEGASMAVRVEFLRAAMRGWGFPDDFVAAQVRELVGLSLPGGRLHERGATATEWCGVVGLNVRVADVVGRKLLLSFEVNIGGFAASCGLEYTIDFFTRRLFQFAHHYEDRIVQLAVELGADVVDWVVRPPSLWIANDCYRLVRHE